MLSFILDLMLAHPFGSTIFAGSIASFVYATWKDGKLDDRERSLKGELAARERSLKGELDDRERSLKGEMAARENDVCIKLAYFQNQTGIDVQTLMQLSTVETEFNNSVAYQSRKVNKYIARLTEMNAEKEEAFKSRPIITAAGSKIANIELFSQSTEEFLIREQALCARIAEEKGLVCHLSTKKTRCEVIKVIDGDTFDVLVGSERIRIRAMGYDTPEVCHPKKGFGHWGVQSSEAAELLIKSGKVFHVYLDSIGASKSWTNDRYGRTLAHLAVDGILIGQTLIENGHAAVVDVFPIEKDILTSYKKAEYDAKLNDLGMWLDINRYKLERKPVHQQKKWNLTSVVKNEHEIDMIKVLMKDAFSAMLGKNFSKSKSSFTLHNEECRYLKIINETEGVELTEEMLESGKIRTCKVCNGDEFSRELMSK